MKRSRRARHTDHPPRPWLTIHPRCKYLIRTLPLMVQDTHDAEDLDSESDDHACDAVRYLLMGGLRAGRDHVDWTARRRPTRWRGIASDFHVRATGVLK